MIMKTLHTIYTNFAKRTAIILTLLLTLGATSAWGAEEVMFPDNGNTFNSNWNKTTRTARQAYAESKAAIQLMGENGGVYGEIYSKNTYTGISAVSVKATASNSVSLKLYYSTDQSTWTELSSISLTKSTTSYSSKSFSVTGIPSSAVYLKFRSSASSTYIYSVTVTTASGYAVTYNNGGRGTAPLNTNASSVTLSAITATGYTNTGWTADVAVKNGSTTISTGELIENGTTVTLTQATTFTAQWEINSYKVTWEPNGGNWSGNASDKVEDYNYGATITTPTNPTRYGYNFTGWNPTPATTMPASDQTYTAQWTEKSLTNYRTTCSAQPSPSLSADETELAFNEVTVNSSKELEFTLSGSNLTADAILALSGTNADLFSVSQTSVTPTDGSITDQTITVTYTPDAKASHFATLTISSTDAAPIQISLSGTGVAQTAEYNVEHYRQNIVDDEYTLCETETSYGEVDASVTPAVKTYEGFTAPSTQTVTILSDGSTTVKYQYTRNSYTLTWNVNGGNALTGDYTSGSVKYEATITKPTDPTREGYTFAGWSPEVAATMPAANTTYIAQWTEKTAPNISWSALTCTVTIASPSNELPTLNNPNSLSPIVYSSSATDVATIDNQGRIILKSAGETTITAAFAETEDYKSAEVTYTLTVVESDNCRWIETDIEDIEYGDEVVVAMETATGTYALNSSGGTTSAPPATSVTVTNKEITSSIQEALMWFIEKDGNNLIFHPITDPSKNLYCNTSSDNNNRVRVGSSSNATINHKFIISGNHLQNSITNHYLGIYYSNGNAQDWRGYASSTQFAGQTLKFYKRVCLSEGQYWVKWMVAGQEYTAGDPTTFTDGTITAIPDAPDNNTLADCGATKFMGWSTDNIGSTPDADAPTDLFTTVAEAQSKIGGITENKTFHAVFASADGEDIDYSNVHTSNATIGKSSNCEESSIEINGTEYYAMKAGSGKSKGADTITVPAGTTNLYFKMAGWTGKGSNTITLSGATADPTTFKTIADAGINGNDNTYTLEGEVTNYSTVLSDITKETVLTLSNSGGNQQFVIWGANAASITYSNYVTSCCETPAPTNGTYDNVTGSGNAMSLTLNWEGTVSWYHITCANPIIDEHIESTSYNVSSLTECEEYTFYVSADPKDGCESEAIIISAQPFSGAKTVTFVYGNEQPNTTFTTDCDNQSTALPTPTRSGYRFLGWFTEESGGTEITENPYTPTTDITLHAQWVQVFTVTYDANNATSGTVPTDANSPYDINKIVTVQGNTGNLQRLGYNFVGWNTAIDASGTQYSAGQTFTITENTTLYAQWIENYCTLTFTIPSGGGQAVSAPEQVLNGYPITFPEVTGISSEYWCETFIGWTTEEPNGEGLWDGTPTIYESGTNSEAITANTTFYAVYQRSGGGASGTVDLKCEDVSTWKSDALIGNSNAYGTVITRTATDGSVWTTNGQIADAGDINLKEEYYLKLPELPGSITTIRMKVSQGNCTDACIDYAGNETEYKVNFKSTTGGNVLFSSEITKSRSRTIEITDGTYYTGYLYCSSGTLNVHAVSVDYGPAPIISHSLQCGCAIDEFNLTYNANEGNFPNSTTNCEGVTGYKFSEHEDKYTICSSVPTLDGYKFIGWTTNPNGSGDLYTSGQEIKCVPSSEITLYAQYERVYTVIFDNQNTINATTQTRSGAAVDVPTATEPCGSEWQFVGWSTEEIAPMSLKPTITIAPGINTYIPEGDITLYAIYQKTSLSKEFVAGKTGAYKISNGSDKYASSFSNGHLNSADNLADATTYYITYTASDDGKYTIQQADGQYIAYSGESTSLEQSEEPYYWKITKDGELWQVTTIAAVKRYLKHLSDFRAYTDAGNIGLIATEGQYYYRTMSCDDNFDITFNNQNGATIHWQNGYPQAAYQDLEGGTTITTFPTASYEGWTFIGWRALEYEESTSAPESSSVYGGLDGISGNALTITANVTMYPVFTQFLDNDPFDEVNGGDYYMYYIADRDIDTSVDEYGAANRIYAGGWQSGGTSDSYGATQSCAEATLFTFTKLSNGKWSIYDNTKGRYLCAGATDNNLALNSTTATYGEWTITVHNGNQVNAVSKDGYTLSAYSPNATSGTFKNYATSNFNNNGAYYYRIYVGSCTERVFTTAPSTEPIITLNGDVKVTSTATQSVKAASVLTVSASNIATSNLSITSDNAAFIVSPTTITVVDKKVGVTPITITYKPTITSDGTETATITVSDGNEASESITVTGRHLPTDFVIAAKWGDNWYAMPADMNSQSSTEGWLIEVDDAANPTKAIAAPNTTKYGLKSVYTSNSSGDRFANYGERLVFVENVEESTPVANKTLYNGGDASGSKTNIQVYAQYANYYSDQNQAPRYEWIPMTTDLTDYTLTSGAILSGDAVGRTVSLDNHGIFGTLLQDKSYNGMVRLLPVDNFYDPAELQVVEWKQNSVSVMYTGAGTKYTTKVGNNAESDVQALTSIDHAVYSLSTTDLTAATNQPLIITIKDDADATIGAIKLTVPAIVSDDKNSTSLVTSNDLAKATDIVVLDGATLTAGTTKYTYNDIVVYPGGKLVIGQSGKLGMYTLTFRAGSSWGAAVYEYKYPEFVLNTTTANAYSNTSGKINLDYVTTKEQYYTFVAPFDVKTKDIKYPVDIYGSNVAAANKGSFEFQYYDGAARAEGNTGWKVVEEDPTNGATLTAGQGYTFLGMPKKINGTRQKYGIHRISMTVAAGTAMAHENSVQSITVAPHPSTKNNNSGWNLIGNPYMSTIGGLTNEDIQVGKLVHTTDANDNWTGGWHWDEETVQSEQRFLVIPSNDGQSYEAVQASNATLPAFKNFFVQISNEGANALIIPVVNRVEKSLAPARYAEEQPEKDVEVAIVLEQDEAHSDQMDFLINNIYTEDFERDADFTKMMNATNLNLYGVHPYDNLSFVAIDNNTARGSVAIGYQVPQAGEYTLRMSDKPYVMFDRIEALYVTDHEMSPEVTTDIMSEPYRFTVAKAETNHTRFTVSITLKANTEDDVTTILENVDVGKDQPIKFFYQDKLYILRNGIIYDAMGKQVQTINK